MNRISDGIASSSWQQLGWDTIRLSVPAEWEIARIGSRDILLTDGQSPRLELKWGRVNGAFSHTRQLKRLIAGSRASGGITLRPRSLPPDWESVLDRFQASSFSWEDVALVGHGLLLFCPRCRQASLLQFVHRKGSPRETHLEQRVLASFRDHADVAGNLLRVYDIRALLPGDYRLHRFRLDAGSFHVNYRNHQSSVTLYRWGLATMRLRQESLAQFGQASVPIPHPAACIQRQSPYPVVQWRFAAATRGARLLSRLRRIPPCQTVTLWQLPDQDRILGVAASGKTSADIDRADTIAATYEIIS